MIKFLLFSDFHYCKTKYAITTKDLEKVLQRGADEKVDFVMQCGDFCVDPIHSPEIYKVLLENKHNLPVYGIVGNHELEVKGNYLDFVAQRLTNREVNRPFPNASYWYTDINGIRLIGLDTNYSLDPVTNEWEHTESGRTMGKPGNINLAYAHPDEMVWLDETLADAQEKGLKAILFSHHPLSGCFNFNCGNGFEVRELLKKYKHTGVMCINGDLHAEYYAGINDVIYYAITATQYLNGNQKKEPAYPEDYTYEYLDYDENGNLRGSYQKKFIDLPTKNLYYSEEPLCAIVTIDDEGVVTVDGMQSRWLFGIEPKNKDLQHPYDPYITNKFFKLDF